MQINFGPRGVVEINDARIIYRNFSGKGDKYNREGDRNFAVVIPDKEMADALINDTNRFGVGWNVKVRESRDEGGEPFMYLPVKVRFGDRGPNIYLQTGDKMNQITEATVSCLDNIDIVGVDLDIRPYDDEINGKAFRSAYLNGMHIYQRVDRFEERFNSRREDDELAFN